MTTDITTTRLSGLLTSVLGLSLVLASPGCGEPGEGEGDDDLGTDAPADADAGDQGEGLGDDGEGEAPGKEGEGAANFPQARQVARLSADQFHAALQVATGQSWTSYDSYAAALGKPDLAEVTDEGTSFSVSFDKFVHDAARATCRAAIDADLAGGGEGEGESEGVILRYASASDRNAELYLANLQYLLLRFLAVEVEIGDPRLDPWLTLLYAPAPEDGELDDTLMADRWWAICVGLATHPDFLSY
ncbi:hypothetical protein G6O69_25475 [Pseudenhygromyxa sp. WMMC2535]|uniref:hypothetical protein n=1 Tax=Pseudenhygromyxa sp. WMMC2535 TaxID=2712867 RepID=UPI0015582897|nr:hypothetical protein [Pseudenhygromyxa sp. WMMC2535]NVB41215.1 hypothetical protein [Pseudenhygromyxa sp. WMMC2535]